jgi:hypothetical protein
MQNMIKHQFEQFSHESYQITGRPGASWLAHRGLDCGNIGVLGHGEAV